MPTVFITGVKNTGFCIAEKFASEGFDVAISTRKLSDVEPLAEMLAKKYNIKARGYSLEMSDVDDIKRVFSCIKEDFGSLDTFVANAANLGVEMDFLTADEDEFASVVDVNLKGSFFCAQQAALMMKEKKSGSIVFMSSVHSHQCIFGRSLYTATKGGINALMRALAIELAQYGIRSNCVIAGAIRTDRWDNLTQEQITEKRANWPLGLESTGEDIANGVFYLGTDLSKTVTGTELTIDSGILISLLPYKEAKK
ncbi:MAG: SDR family oxidoreductase [Acutalibacteraceae bacterium]|nr:SDR family oxidoreductase [Acutalibacteraceae bacterium]